MTIENNGAVDTSIDTTNNTVDTDEMEVVLVDTEVEKTERETKLEEIARNQKIRAENAERELKELKKLHGDSSEKKVENKDTSLSPLDLYALMDAKVPQEDVEEVTKAAKLLNKTVAEALKDTTVQAILKTREEHRKTADATNTGTKRPAQKTKTVDEIVRDASKGVIPEKGSKEAEELFWARRGKR